MLRSYALPIIPEEFDFAVEGMVAGSTADPTAVRLRDSRVSSFPPVQEQSWLGKLDSLLEVDLNLAKAPWQPQTTR